MTFYFIKIINFKFKIMKNNSVTFFLPFWFTPVKVCFTFTICGILGGMINRFKKRYYWW
jgi:hypothetical protein